jgi:hypothetical protein
LHFHKIDIQGFENFCEKFKFE